jgi:hypothetical protein
MVAHRAVYDVIFRRNQFRTSLSGRGQPNPFAEAFLSPSKAQAYLNRHAPAESAERLFALAQRTAARITPQLDRGENAARAFSAHQQLLLSAFGALRGAAAVVGAAPRRAAESRLSGDSD